MKYFTLFSALLITACIHAQAPRGFYLVGGVNQTSLKSDDLLADPGMGFKGGINFQFGYHESFNYQIEIMFNNSNLNFLTVDENLEPIDNSKFVCNSVDFGLFFNYYIIKPEEDKFFLGPQVGLNFTAGQFIVAASSDINDVYYLPYLYSENDFYNMSKFGLGGGIGLTGGYNDFRFDIRYTMGFSNVLANVEINSYDENNNYTGPELEAKVNMLSFTVSYRLNKLFGGE